MNKAVGIIPARWASTRFPGKPLYLIAGKPLLRYVWERCRRSKKLDSIIIATDDMRIAKAAFDWGAEVALTSPHHQSGTDRIAEVVRKATAFAFVVNIQGDEPLVDPRLIDRIVKKLRSDRRIEVVTAAHPFSDSAEASSPHQVKVAIDSSGSALNFFREPIPLSRLGGKESFAFADQKDRRSGGRLVFRHQGIYGFRRDALLRFTKWKRTSRERNEGLEQLRALENGVKVHVLVTKQGSPGVDTPEDAKNVAASLSRGVGLKQNTATERRGYNARRKRR
jgi:3-deoxy-manno-octulosonate cytidylyltransferase (CMP-KDO synthetase)